jgi:hypothetical protein
MKRTPEGDQIDAGNGIIRVGDELLTERDRKRQNMVESATQALSGETPITQGEDAGWLFIGGVNFNQPLYVKDGDGVPLFKVMVEPMPNLPADYLTRVLPALLKRSPKDGSVLRLTLRFDDDSLAYSNQPTEEQMAWLMQQMERMGALKK